MPSRSGRVVQHCAHCTDGREFETQSKPPQCLWTHRQVCGSKRHCCHADLHTVSRCHTRGEFENHPDEKACKNESTLGLNLGQISPKVQNRGISGPTKRTYVLQIIFFPPKIYKKKKKFDNYHTSSRSLQSMPLQKASASCLPYVLHTVSVMNR